MLSEQEVYSVIKEKLYIKNGSNCFYNFTSFISPNKKPYLVYFKEQFVGYSYEYYLIRQSIAALIISSVFNNIRDLLSGYRYDYARAGYFVDKLIEEGLLVIL